MTVDAIPYRLTRTFAAFLVLSLTIGLAALTAGRGHTESPTAENRTVGIIRVWITPQGPFIDTPSVITVRQSPGADTGPTFFPVPPETADVLPGVR
ncbi:hypothetical protein [Streptomyces sp. NPDC048637]|uniref:hypothetical protein n=1 Tax=Streptomyces sp. NPDC048637 TaxID=3155636 RepID=UPI00342AF704